MPLYLGPNGIAGGVSGPTLSSVLRGIVPHADPYASLPSYMRPPTPAHPADPFGMVGGAANVNDKLTPDPGLATQQAAEAAAWMAHHQPATGKPYIPGQNGAPTKTEYWQPKGPQPSIELALGQQRGWLANPPQGVQAHGSTSYQNLVQGPQYYANGLPYIPGVTP